MFMIAHKKRHARAQRARRPEACAHALPRTKTSDAPAGASLLVYDDEVVSIGGSVALSGSFLNLFGRRHITFHSVLLCGRTICWCGVCCSRSILSGRRICRSDLGCAHRDNFGDLITCGRARVEVELAFLDHFVFFARDRLRVVELSHDRLGRAGAL